jgi:hypothetical protein
MEYDDWNLCVDLKPKEKCFRLFQYDNGTFNEEFHMHVPKHKISNENSGIFLQALVFRFLGGTGMSAEHILAHLVNNRAGMPNREDTFMWHTTHPEPGALRHTCGTNTKAVWDEVISPNQFRTAGD